MLIALNKPFNVVSQFSGEDHTLKEFVNVPDIYPAGRLDKDSEGLLLLTDDGALQAKISSPKFKLPKSYYALVERVPDDDALAELRRGVELKDGMTRPAEIERVAEPEWLWPRDPPVRYRKNVQDCWLKIVITEGRNRQVRRMTAAIGHPTLRLVRYAIGDWTIEGLAPGEWREITAY